MCVSSNTTDEQATCDSLGKRDKKKILTQALFSDIQELLFFALFLIFLPIFFSFRQNLVQPKSHHLTNCFDIKRY